MKKLTVFIVMLLCGLQLTAQNGRIDLRSNTGTDLLQSDFISLQAIFNYGSIESMDVNTERGLFSEIGIDGCYPSGEMGAPELPASHQLLAVPFGATPTVSVTGFTATDYKLADYGVNTLYPHQPSVRKDQRPEDVKFVYDEAAYQTRGLAEAPVATIEVQGTLRGIRVGSLVVNPVSYDAATNTLRVFNHIEVRVDFEGADIEETERMLLSTYSPYFDIVYRQMFNYRQIQDVYDDHPDLMAYPVHMIVLTPENYVSTLQPWINWKIQKGFDVNVVTTAQAGSNYSSIRSYIQNLYNSGVSNNATPTFLVIAGDVAQVPNTTGSNSQKVTDLYYGSIDNDYFPDMFYSRMSAENTSQLTCIVNKILEYEQYIMPDPTYLNNVTLIAGWDSYWNAYVGQPTINYATTYYYNTAHGFTTVNTYLNQSQYSGCYNTLSTGVGFVNYTAHGDNQMWYQPQLTNSGVNQLTNTDKYFLAMGNCCLAANFGYSQPCFGEAMIRAENKAAYSYIGSCPSTYWYEDYYFGVGATYTFNSTPTQSNTATGVYDGVWMDDTYNTVSSMVFLGNLAVCYAHAGSYQTSSNPTYYWQAYHVLGDGSIMPFRVNPAANTVSHDGTFPMNTSSFTVNAEEGSYVGISKDNVLLGTALVPASGTVNVTVTPVTQEGEVRIVVTKPQRQPYISDIPAVNSGTQSYTVTVSASPADGGTVTGGGTYVQGQSCTVTATANSGYTFSNWTENGSAVSTNSSYTFVVTEDRELVANFQEVPCYAPSGLTAMASENSVNLSWQASSTAVSYNIYRDGVSIANNITTLGYIDANLEYSHTYCYTVCANCANGNLSDPSNQACATTGDYPCEAPAGISVNAINYTDIGIVWSGVATAESYNIYRNGTMIVSGLPAEYTSYYDTELNYGEYCYYVEANCGLSVSDPSETACATLSIPCNAPEDFTAEYVYANPDDFGVQLQWQSVASILPSYFYLYRSTDNENFELVEQMEVTELLHPFIYFDTIGVGTYYYALAARYVFDGQDCTSDEVYADVKVTNVAEADGHLTFYPNPADETLHVESAEPVSEVRVYNLMGVLVKRIEGTGAKTEVSLSGLPAGVYFMQADTNEATIVKRFVKN